MTQLPPISPYINTAFVFARAKLTAEHTAWTNLSGILAGRFNLFPAVMNIQRQGDLDLLLKCMEDEAEANKAAEAADATGLVSIFHYQLMLSEAWVVGCYEFLRAFRQRDSDAVKEGKRPSGVSDMEEFKSLFADFELLRMPMTKFEIAKDKAMREPLALQRIGDPSSQTFYDSKDPWRSHMMAIDISARGSVRWLLVDHATRAQRWVERRELAERLLAMGTTITPAGILEAEERATAEEATKATKAP